MKSDRTMEERMRGVIQSTWEVIGSDAREIGVRKLSEAVEMVLDADYCRMYASDKEAIETLYKMDYKDMLKLAKKSLKHYF
jgi:hypothetical protein